MLMKKLLSGIDVAPIFDEIDMNLWEKSLGAHNPITWKNTDGQIIINHEQAIWEPFKRYSGSLSEDMKDMFLPDFWPTENYFYYPQTHKFLLLFKKLFGGKLARAMYYHTLPKKGVGKHSDGARLSPEDVLTNMYYKKDRFSLVTSGEFMFTVDEETEHFKAGDLWWFANKLPHVHSSYNHGDISKTNLIFDVEGSHWRDCE